MPVAMPHKICVRFKMVLEIIQLDFNCREIFFPSFLAILNDFKIGVSALRKTRTDLKFIVNDLLLNLNRMNGLFLGVDKHGKNSQSKRGQISELFASDFLVCIFPAGLVSRKINGQVRDLEWKKTFLTLSKENNRLSLSPAHSKVEC